MKEAEELWPVYEFRPLLGELVQEVFRFAGGKWLSDDGQHDLAFIGYDKRGFPMGLGVDLPYQRNILWSWLTEPGNWGRREPKHPGGNAWHYMLRGTEKEWGGSWDRHRHPNRIAYEAASREMSRRAGCANGAGPQFNPDDRVIRTGLLRVRESGSVVVPPNPLGCMYCSLVWSRHVLLPGGE